MYRVDLPCWCVDLGSRYSVYRVRRRRGTILFGTASRKSVLGLRASISQHDYIEKIFLTLENHASVFFHLITKRNNQNKICIFATENVIYQFTIPNSYNWTDMLEVFA